MSCLRSTLIVLFLASGFNHTIGQNTIQVGFWNVENLFDTTNSALTIDDDFTPSGRYAWTETQLFKKFSDLSYVIHNISEIQNLALLGLAEIENFDVLDRLNSEFIKRDYQIIHKESPDERGIDCGLLYDPSVLTLQEQHFIPLFLAGNEKTRDIIEAEFSYSGSKNQHSLYVFINHWPSRWGGEQKTDPLRRSAARTLRTRVDQILQNDPDADIIIMGDFNDHPTNESVKTVLRAKQWNPNPYPGDLINTTWDLHMDPKAGTYVYRGVWGTLDQIIISPGLADLKGFSWILDSTKPFKPDYLIESEGNYKGWPYRMYRGGKYYGGFSDHLPITCQLQYSDN